MSARILEGDVLLRLKDLASESVDVCITSPPYWGLRDYGIAPVIWGSVNGCGHEWGDILPGEARGGSGTPAKNGNGEGYARGEARGCFCVLCGAWSGQLGLEPTFQLYVKHIVGIFSEVKRVLKPTGSLYLNLGDTYSGSHGNTEDYPSSKDAKGKAESMPKRSLPSKTSVQAKCLIGIPERIMLAMIDDGWILRNKIVWSKPNHMPSSVKDRYANGYETVFFFSKSQRYYFDLDSVREPHKMQENRPPGVVRAREWGYDTKLSEHPEAYLSRPKQDSVIDASGQPKRTYSGFNSRYDDENPPNGGKNPGDVWSINTRPYPDAHFATFPESLVERPVKASCPAQVCSKCGKARERIVKVDVDASNLKRFEGYRPMWDATYKTEKSQKDSDHVRPISAMFQDTLKKQRRTIGWTDCGCRAPFVPGVVLDPFMGSGTTGLVALKFARSFIGIEIKPEYVELAKRRLGPWMSQVRLEAVEPTERER